MAQPNEQDRYKFFTRLTDEQRARADRIEDVKDLVLNELQIGDRIALISRDARSNDGQQAVLILDVISKDQMNQDKNGMIKVTFKYMPGFMDFTFYDDYGKPLALKIGTTLESGFSSVQTRRILNYDIPRDQSRYLIKTKEAYWFENAGGIGQVAIVRGITKIGLLRKAN